MATPATSPRRDDRNTRRRPRSIAQRSDRCNPRRGRVISVDGHVDESVGRVVDGSEQVDEASTPCRAGVDRQRPVDPGRDESRADRRPLPEGAMRVHCVDPADGQLREQRCQRPVREQASTEAPTRMAAHDRSRVRQEVDQGLVGGVMWDDRQRLDRQHGVKRTVVGDDGEFCGSTQHPDEVVRPDEFVELVEEAAIR